MLCCHVAVLQLPEEPVWQQLDRACDRSPLCALRRLAALREENAQLQQQLREAQGKLAECSTAVGGSSRESAGV